ncbi:unnamed protein product [Durusdinium trenchii]|uniref:Uncharacterized protein n=1 Tax=Durusdinium trenchii TaxID=1381693 RepID=A0ABP0RPF2_9DINO
MMSKDGTDSKIPSWDGSSRTWRRYLKEVSWFAGGTKPAQRKSLPNAAAIMSEYFSFKRRPQEPIAQFLARESLGFEEFAEALAQLKEEKEGHDPALRNFDLPDMSPHPDESDHDGRLWRQSDRYQWRHWEPPDGSDGGHRAPEREDGYAGVLQGWRLLAAASLTQEQWRDILATTGNKLEYEKIADALTTLWDEQLMGYRQSHQTSQRSFSNHWIEQADDAELQDMLEQEKAAEAMAMEARRTWSQAQKATDCPDKSAPRKGSGKFLSPAELDQLVSLLRQADPAVKVAIDPTKRSKDLQKPRQKQLMQLRRQSLQHVNPVIVKKALEKLQADLPTGRAPAEELPRAVPFPDCSGPADSCGFGRRLGSGADPIGHHLSDDQSSPLLMKDVNKQVRFEPDAPMTDPVEEDPPDEEGNVPITLEDTFAVKAKTKKNSVDDREGHDSSRNCSPLVIGSR